MKAERRHELQTNNLAKFIEDVPYYLRFHANKLLVGVIVVCAIVLLVRYRNNALLQAREAARQDLANAHTGISRMEQLQRFIRGGGVAEAEDRKQLANQVEAAIDQVLQNAKDSQDAPVRADALIARGDLNWTMANLPSLPGAATQPALSLPHSSNEYLQNAQGAYQQVLKEYSAQMVPKANALLSLSAIEENRGNWDKAADYLNQLNSDPSIAEAFKQIAQQNLAMIPALRNPVYLGSYSSTQPSTQPATQPMR